MKKKIILKLVILFLIVGLFNIIIGNKALATDNYYTEAEGVESDNVLDNNYISYYAKNIYSYLVENDDGTITRIESIDNVLYIETYNQSFELQSSQSIEGELSIFGGFYSGEEYNYIVYGENNLDEDDEFEVVRVVKYSKNWERIKSLSICGNNIYTIFEAGSCRMTETGGYLYIDTCKTECANWIDGLHHQSKIVIQVDEDNMEDFTISSIGSVSHSFNQYILTDDENIYTVDQGDSYPGRGVLVFRSKTSSTNSNKHVNVLSAVYISSYNTTGISIGGAELSTDNIIIAGNSVPQDGDTLNTSATRNIFLSVVSKSDFEYETTWITDYEEDSGIVIETPQLVKISDEKFLLMWQEVENNVYGRTKMVLINEQGELLTDIITVGCMLSDCQPIVYNGLVTWYVTVDSSPIFFYIDVSSDDKFYQYDNQNVLDVNCFEHFEVSTTSNGAMTLTSFDDEVEDITVASLDLPWINVSISSYLFRNKTTVKNVTISEGITAIPYEAFYNSSVESVTLPSTLETIDKMAFASSSLNEITLPEGLKEIGEMAFEYCDELTSVSFPSTLSSIGVQAFYNCPNLLEVELTGDIETLANYAFYMCTGLTKVTIHGTIEEMGNYVFGYCSSLTEVSMPNVVNISKGAFNDCTALEKIEFSENLKIIGEKAFAYTGLTGTVTVPETVTEICEKAFYCCYDIEKLIVENPETIIDGYIFQNRKTMMTGETYKAIEGIDIASSTSQNTSYATVTSDGTITAIKGFSTDISCSVKYYDSEGVEIGRTYLTIIQGCTSFVANSTELTLEPDSSETITIKILPSTAANREISWSSSNDDVAIVTDSSVTKVTIQGLKVGTAIITGTTTDGTNLSVSINVNVVTTDDDTSSVDDETPSENNDDNNDTNPNEDDNNSNSDTTPNEDDNDDTFSFTDVSTSSWYYEYVEYCYENGIMTGYEGTTLFGPNDNVKRGALALIIYRMAGSPEVSSTSKFIDVQDENKYYYDAIIWASENGIVTGYGETGLFKPEATITRQELATMLYRYAKYEGKTIIENGDYTTFSDANSVSNYATSPLNWAIGEGIISGYTNTNTLVPTGNATRAQVATMIMRYCSNL